MLPYESWLLSEWTSRTTQLAADLQGSDHKDDTPLIERCLKIVDEAFEAQTPHSTKQDKKLAAIATSQLLTSLQDTKNHLPKDATPKTKKQLTSAIKATRQLKNHFTPSKPSQQTHTASTTTTTPSIPSKWDKQAITELLTKENAIDEKRHGQTPLAFAVSQKDAALVEALLHAGADPNQDVRGSHPLFFDTLTTGNEEIALLFIQAGVDPTLQGSFGQSAFMKAIDAKHFKVAEALLTHENNFRIISEMKKRPNDFLLAAAQSGNIQLLQRMLAFGILPEDDQKNPLYTPLLAAINHGNRTAVKLLLDCGANPNKNTPLAAAAWKGDFESFELLLEHGADLAALTKKVGMDELEDAKTSPLDDLKAEASPHYHRVLAYLEANYKTEVLKHKEMFRISGVGHSCKLEGTVQVKPYRNTLNFMSASSLKSFTAPLEWSNPIHWMHMMAKTTKLFSQAYNHLLSDNDCKILCETLEFASQWKHLKNIDVVNRIQKGLPTFLMTGPNAHGVILVACGTVLGICDKRQKMPVQVFRFAPQKLTERNVKALREAPQNYNQLLSNYLNRKENEPVTESEFASFLNQILRELNAKQASFEKKFQENCPLESVEGHSCAWESTEGGVWNIFALLGLSSAGIIEDSTHASTSTDNSKEKKEHSSEIASTENMQKVLAQQNKVFYSWLAFNQIFYLARYIADNRTRRLIRPEATPAKVKSSTKTRKLFAKNDQLIHRAMQVISGNLDKNLDEGIVALIRELEKIVKTQKNLSRHPKK